MVEAARGARRAVSCSGLSGRALPYQRRTARRNGFTLVEVLAALLLGGVVVSLSAALSVQAAKAHKAARAAVDARWERQQLVNRFEEDVRSALTNLPNAKDVFRVNPAPGRLLEVTTLAEAPSNDALFRERLPAVVTYVSAEDPSRRGSRQLHRELRVLVAGPGDACREVVARDLGEVIVEAYYENGWAQHHSGQAKGGEPRALRFTCRFSGGVGELRRTVVLSNERQTR